MPNNKVSLKNNLSKNENSHKVLGKINYGSNMVDKVERATKNQAKKVKESGFASQFDTIMLDATEPVGVNQSNIIKRGDKREFDTSLQRDIDFVNEYSEFLPTQMHYDVTDTVEMMSSNMDYHSSKRDLTTNNLDHSHRLFLNTGQDPFYKSKSEFDPVNIIEPMKDLTYVNGAPVFTDYLESRYLPSNKNNMGDLPFKSGLKVLPGIHGETDPANTVYRTNPKNVDELRSKTNPKISFKANKIESGLKGEMRGTDYNLTKYKKKTYKHRNMDDYLPNAAVVNKRKLDPKVKKSTTNRSVSAQEFGHLNDSNKGKKHISKYTETSKTSFNDDSISRSISNKSNKPVLQNKGSYSNNPNERTTTSHDIAGSLYAPSEGNYVLDPNDIPLNTLRQLMIEGDTNIGVTETNNSKSYVFSKDFILPTNNRTNTAINNIEGNMKPDVNVGYSYDPNDIARQTIRETTEVQEYTGNLKPDVGQTHYYNDKDKARQTIRETTEVQQYAGSLKPDVGQTHYYNDKDLAKQTIRETTEVNQFDANIQPTYGGLNTVFTDRAKQTIRETTEVKQYDSNIQPTYGGLNTVFTDKAKQTIRETTENQNYVGNLNPEIKATNYYDDKDSARQTIRQTTENQQHVSNIQPTYGGINTHFSDKAKQTVKETTEVQKHVTNLQSSYGGPNYTNYKEKARPTIKQSTLYSSNGNIRSDGKSYTRDENDKAKETIKETTLHQEVGYALGTVNGEKGYALDKNDKAKTTTKETTLFSRKGNAAAEVNKSYAKDRTDVARPTIKQNTLLKNRTGPLGAEVEKKVSHEAANNMDIDERREILTYNRMPNKRSDKGIRVLNKKELRLKEENFLERENYGCDTSNSNIGQLKKIFTRNKLALNNPGYRINNDFINTLESNPLVNDIRHQKNK